MSVTHPSLQDSGISAKEGTGRLLGSDMVDDFKEIEVPRHKQGTYKLTEMVTGLVSVKHESQMRPLFPSDQYHNFPHSFILAL